MTLRTLLSLVSWEPSRAAGNPEVTSMVADSRHAGPGSLFVCTPLQGGDTHAFLKDAAERGATAALVHSEEGFATAIGHGLAAALLPSELREFNTRVGELVREFTSDPTLDLRVIGVTGTNGKTTVAWLLRQALAALGRRAAYLGTLGVATDRETRELPNTTLFPVELGTEIAGLHEQQFDDLVMEVSSHALDQARAAGVRFDRGVFTNLSRDHLDYHGTMEAYALAKKALFTEVGPGGEKAFAAIVNADDPVGADWLAEWIQDGPPTLSFGFEAGSVRGEVLELAVDRVRMKVTHGEAVVEVTAGLGGNFNSENLLASIATLISLGYPLTDIGEAVSAVKAVPGRFETIPNERGIGVIVDYAHTPDAMEKLLRSVRAATTGRVACVFGCGGDRDRTKRPMMMGVSTRLCARTWVTSDNPRTEDPEQIFADIVRGAEGEFEVVEDRAEAIRAAISWAEPGDVVVIAGKGHENYQIIGREKRPFDDRVVAREVLR